MSKLVDEDGNEITIDEQTIRYLISEKKNLSIQLQLSAKETCTLEKQLNSKKQISKKVNEFYQSKNFCDVILVTNDDKNFPVHKLILASQSDGFLELFDTSINVTKIEIDVNSQILQYILSYMYNTSDIVVDQYNFEGLLEAALLFDINYIKSECLNFIETNDFGLESLKDFLQKHVFDIKLNEWICSFVTNKFGELTESIKKLVCTKINGQCLIKIISHENFTCPHEDNVYDFIIRWAKFDEHNRKTYLHDLMGLVRKPFLSKKYLLKMFSEPLLKDFKMNLNMKEILQINLSKYVEKFEEYRYDINFKKRVPKSLGNSNIIFAITESTNHSKGKCTVMHARKGDIWKWKPGNELLIPPHEYSKVIAFGKSLVYAIGGKTKSNQKATDNVDYLDLSYFWQKWIPATSMKYARYNFAVCADRENIYAIGGVGIDDELLDTMEVLNVQSGLWNVVKMNFARTRHSAVFHNRFLYVVGGLGVESNPLASIERYDTTSGHWSEISLPFAIWNTCTVVFNNTLFVIGGLHIITPSVNAISKTIYELDLDCEHWSESESLDFPRQLGNAVIVNNTYLVINGGFSREHENFGSHSYTTEVFHINEDKPYLSNLHLEYYSSGSNDLIVLPEKLFTFTNTEFYNK